MRLLTLTAFSILVIVLPHVCHVRGAAADPAEVWDRTYKHRSWSGQWPCPDSKQDVVVANGQFSIPWDIKDLNGDEWYTIGHFEGAVRASGMTENLTVTLLQPMPRKALKILQDANESLDKIREMKFKVRFSGDRKRAREIVVTGDQGMCSAYWAEDRNAVLATAPTGAVDCSTGQYAVGLWSARRPYKAGELSRIATPGQPTRLYRCIDDCTPGMAPVRAAGGESDDGGGVSAAAEGDGWAFFGECAGSTTPEASLPATGSAKWDTSYHRQGAYTQDWRCPHELSDVVVSRGKLSIPWRLSTESGRDRADKAEDLTVGSIEGVIAADGTTTQRTKFTVDTLPPEITERMRITGDAAMASLRLARPTMKFIFDVGKKNPNGQGRRALLNFGRGCEYHLEAKDYKSQEFREEDGWRVDCDPDQAWHPKIVYHSGDEATVGGAVKHKYRCKSSQCDGRPGNSYQWEKSGRCQ